MLRNLLIYSIITPLTLVAVVLIFTAGLVDPTGNIKFVMSRFWLRSILRTLNVKISISGTENIQQGMRYVLMGNHTSIMDIPVLSLAIPMRLSFMAKKELFHIPLFGWSLRFIGHIPIDRKHPRKALRQMEAFVNKKKYKSHSIIFFPEGTRSPDGKLSSFKRGGFNFARNLDLSILPVSIIGAYNLARKGELFVRSGKIKITVHKPVKEQDFENQKECMESVRNTIASGLS